MVQKEENSTFFNSSSTQSGCDGHTLFLRKTRLFSVAQKMIILKNSTILHDCKLSLLTGSRRKCYVSRGCLTRKKTIPL